MRVEEKRALVGHPVEVRGVNEFVDGAFAGPVAVGAGVSAPVIGKCEYDVLFQDISLENRVYALSSGKAITSFAGARCIYAAVTCGWPGVQDPCGGDEIRSPNGTALSRLGRALVIP